MISLNQNIEQILFLSGAGFLCFCVSSFLWKNNCAYYFVLREENSKIIKRIEKESSKWNTNVCKSKLIVLNYFRNQSFYALVETNTFTLLKTEALL